MSVVKIGRNLHVVIGDGDVVLSPSVAREAELPAALVAYEGERTWTGAIDKTYYGQAASCWSFVNRDAIQVVIDKLTNLRDDAFPPDDDDEDILHFCQPFIPFVEPVPD